MKTILTLFLITTAGFLYSQGEFLWGKYITNLANSIESVSEDIVVDDDQYAYITANYSGTVLDTTGTIYTPYGKFNVLISKIDPFGNIVWAKQLNGLNDDVSYSITIDNYKNCYVTGAFSDSLLLDGTFIAKANTFAKQLYVLKFDTDGNLIWHYTPSYSTNSSKALDIEADYLGNCYVTGSFIGNIRFGTDTLTNATTYNHQSGIIFKLDANGSVDWYQQLKGQQDSYDGIETGVTHISKAGNNCYFFAAHYRSSCEFSDTVYNTVSGDLQHQDIIIGKIDNQGNFIWRYDFGVINPSSWDAITAIRKLTTNNSGELCMTGVFGGSNTGMNLVIDTFSMTNGWNEDIFFSKFSTNGNCIWARSVSGGNNPDFSYDLEITPEGDFLIPATMSQTNIFVDTTISGLALYQKGTFVVSGADGSFVSYRNTYPNGTINSGFTPQYCYDLYGNLYTFGKGSPSYSGNTGLYITKISSGDIMFSGTVYRDADMDSIIDISDNLLQNIIIIGDSGVFYTTTNDLGYFEVRLDSNNHTFQPVLPQYWQYVYPSAPGIEHRYAPYTNDSITGINFGLTMIPGITDVRIEMASTRFVPGFQSRIRLSYKNIGTDTSLTGTIKLAYSDTLNFISSSIPFLSHIGDTILWSYDTLLVGEERQFDIYFSVPPDNSLIGQTLNTYCYISPDLPDTNCINNSDTLENIVVGAFDPNYKTNNPIGLYQPGYITGNDSVFEYEIHFQNTGSDSAVNVILVDSLPSQVDVSSFEMLVASHDYTYDISGPGVVKWNFLNIYLPDSSVNPIESQGFVKFRIKTRNNLQPGTVIENKAYIYFDFNSPVLTNTVINTVYDCHNIPLFISSQNLCIGETLVAYSQEGSINSYTWMTDSAVYSSSDTLTWFADSVNTFELSLLCSNSLCSKDTSLIIFINQPYQIIESDETICNGDSILIYGVYQSQAGTYTDTLTTATGCDSIISTVLIVESCVGIQEINDIAFFEIYPNPGHGIYTVELSTSDHSKITANIYDMSLKLVRNINIDECQKSCEIDIRDLSNGVYYIHMTVEEKQFFKQIIKN